MPNTTCQVCGDEFEAASIRSRYCSGPCFRAQARLRTASFSPERRRAHLLIGSLRAKGELIRQACEICGSWRYVQAHHDDYAKPLEVRWLCKSHHRQHHHKFGPGLNAFRVQPC